MRRMQSGAAARVGERFEQYGDLYCAPFLGRDVFVLRHPEHIEQVLISQAARFAKPTTGLTARQLARLLGQGLLTSNGELWRSQRRLIQPAFRRERLAEYAGQVAEHTHQMLSLWQDGASIDTSREMMELTLRIVCKALFDHQVSGEGDSVAAAMRVLRSTFGGIDALLPDWLPVPSKRRALAALAEVDGIIYRLIDDARGRQGRDLLSTLSVAGDGGMSRQQLRDELVTLFLAGHETTSHVLHGRAPTWEDLPNLPYAEQVLSEAMRLYPPAYVLARVANCDTELGGFPVTRGSDVVIWLYHTHHDARWFSDPERFDPDRFGPERRKQIPSCAYLPFGVGTRTCIGKQFAVMEALLVLASVAQRFRLLSGGTPVSKDMRVTLAPKNGLPMRLARR
jgi:cytochrome P450